MQDDTTRIGHRTVTSDAVATFGSLVGDYSRIHVDHALGAASPGETGFAHGLLGASWALGAMTLHAPERLRLGDPSAWVSSFAVRFADVVHFGDTLALGCHDDSGDADPDAGSDPPNEQLTAFTLENQHGRPVTTGTVAVCTRPAEGPAATAEIGSADGELPQAEPAVWHAEDFLEHGLRGAARVRTVTETDIVNYANFSGELNPLYLDAVFAEHARFGERIAPPMLCFCLGFSAWLREFLHLPMAGSESSAGHLGDRWRFFAPVHIGDTLQVRYRALSVRRTRSQPSRGVTTFGLQLVNQREEVVQDGEVDMMLAMRELA